MEIVLAKDVDTLHKIMATSEIFNAVQLFYQIVDGKKYYGPELFKRAYRGYFGGHANTDAKAIEAWNEYKETNKLPLYFVRCLLPTHDEFVKKSHF